jgi:hypothetical protein
LSKQLNNYSHNLFRNIHSNAKLQRHKRMTRRELLRLSGSSLLLSALSPINNILSATPAGGTHYLFYDPRNKAQVIANTKTALLKPLYDEWAAKSPDVLFQSINTFEQSGDVIYDFLDVVRNIEHSLMVQLVEPSRQRLDSILRAIEFVVERPYWDYFRDNGQEVLGIQRASFTTVRMLMAREFLADDLPADLEERLLKAVANLGCEACHATVFDMDHPETVKGWDFDEDHAGFYDISMERWPIILGANNLRAAPSGALGLGALALRGKDPRAQGWLDTAVASVERFLKLFSDDGSFFEGISYLSYSLRTTLPFIDAHRRLIGDRDWNQFANMRGMIDFTQAMQMGKKPDGSADVVNFSDSGFSVFPGALMKLGEYTNSPQGAYAADYASNPRWIYDFLWYSNKGPRTAPSSELLNWRSDLNWIVTRSGWEPTDSVLAFKSGGPANHEHADRNHITFKAYGERLLNDHFGAAYDRRAPGWLMRQTIGHNCVLIDGRGHPYIDGVEGTNDSKAYSTILQYVDKGNLIWWTSDASAAYILNNPHVLTVHRTVLFAKPSAIVILDDIRFRYRPQTVAARFYPDNKDGKARLSIDGNRFGIHRPMATLHGLVASDTDAIPRRNRLDVPAETGDFPCIEIQATEALSHNIVTVFSASESTAKSSPELSATLSDGTWRISAPGLSASITPGAFVPEVDIA